MTSLQSHLDAMGMTGGVCEDIFHNSTGELSSALIPFLDDIDSITEMDILAARPGSRGSFAHLNTRNSSGYYISAHVCKWSLGILYVAT